MDIFKVLGEMDSVKSAIGRAYTQATDTTSSMSLNSTYEQYFRVEIYHQSGKVTTQEFKDLNQAMQSYSHQLANYGKRRLRVYAVQPSGESLVVSHR
jgi:cob(I)alamin adenosyltransferase